MKRCRTAENEFDRMECLVSSRFYKHVENPVDKLESLMLESSLLQRNLSNVSSESSRALLAIQNWRTEAHEAIDIFCKKIENELVRTNQKKLQADIAHFQETLIQASVLKQRDIEIFESLENCIKTIRENIDAFHRAPLKLEPLTIDREKVIRRHFRR